MITDPVLYIFHFSGYVLFLFSFGTVRKVHWWTKIQRVYFFLNFNAPAQEISTQLHEVWGWKDVFKEVSYAHQGCIYLVKNAVIMWNITAIKNNWFVI